MMGDPTTGKKGCVKFKCEPPTLPDEVRELLDSVIERTKELDDNEINKLVVGDELFLKISREG
jgi:hypothetical protein